MPSSDVSPRRTGEVRSSDGRWTRVGHVGPSACPPGVVRFGIERAPRDSRSAPNIRCAVNAWHQQRFTDTTTLPYYLPPHWASFFFWSSPKRRDRLRAPVEQARGKIPAKSCQSQTSGLTRALLSPFPPAAGGAKQVICFDLCDPVAPSQHPKRWQSQTRLHRSLGPPHRGRYENEQANSGGVSSDGADR